MPSVLFGSTGEVRWIIRFDEAFLARERRTDETTAQAVERLTKEHFQKKVPQAAGLSCMLIKTANMPADRSNRYAWKVVAGSIVVDATVPPPPHPKQALLDRVQAATSIDEIKTLLKDVIRG